MTTTPSPTAPPQDAMNDWFRYVRSLQTPKQFDECKAGISAKTGLFGAIPDGKRGIAVNEYKNRMAAVGCAYNDTGRHHYWSPTAVRDLSQFGINASMTQRELWEGYKALFRNHRENPTAQIYLDLLGKYEAALSDWMGEFAASQFVTRIKGEAGV